MKKLLFFAFILFSIGLLAQPANDNCAGAQALGTLGDPAPCGAGIQDGATSTVAGTLNGATPENPYVTEAPCTGGSMAAPGNDVWYSFTCPPNGVQGTITITGAAFTPNVAVWQGTCAAMTGVGCALGTPGNCTVNLPSLVPGNTYLIQVSGNTGETGNFTLNATAFVDCSVCNQSSVLTATPPAPATGYAPGQTVHFCYHVSNWNQVNVNWLHGVTVTLGAGWNAASVVATPPASCDGNGTWAYYPAGQTSCASGVLWGPGFYYTSNAGVSTCPADGPGNTYGDNCQGAIAAGTWNFCFDVTVAAGCNPGASLAVSCLSSGDGQSGSWSSTGCLSDVAANANSALNCCPPTMSMTGATCGATGSATASAIVGGAGSQAPYVFAWTGPSGPVSTTTVNPGTSNTINNLPAGTYTVVVTDKNLCASTNTIVVTGGGGITSAVTPHNITCAATGSITTTNAAGGTAPYTYAWTGPGAFASGVQSPTGLTTAGVYTLTVTDHVGCTFTITANVAQTGAITVTVNSPTVCAGGSVNLTAGGATTYSWSTGAITNPITVTPGATSYTVVGTTGTCTNSAVSTVAVTALPVVTVNSATICPGGNATLTGAGATTYSWNTGATTAAITESPGATTSYTVTGTTNTCTNTAVGTITVGAGITVNVNNATICAGTSTVLTANGGTTYSWTPAAGLSATTGATVTANPGATTTYTVTGTSAGCTGTVTSVVTVNPIPVVTASSTSVCAGNAGTITAGGATTYSWNTGVTTAALTDSPVATTSYTVIGTSNTCTNSAVGTITVNPVPTLTVTSASICNGAGPGTLGVSGANTYTWTGGGITGNNSTAPSDNPAATTVYTVNGTSAQGCPATATGTINVIGTPTISVAGGAICNGQTTLILTANSNAATFAWSPAAGLSATTGSSVTANPATTQTYTIVGTAGTCTVSTTAVVTVNNPPVLAVTSSTICVGQQIGTVTVGGANTYTWTGGGITGNTTTNPTDNPANTTSYTVNATDVNTCTATATATITVNPLPIVSVNSPSTCNGSTATLTATGATTYSWTAGLSATTGATVTGSPATTTPYTVTGTDINGCTNTAVATINVISNPTITVANGAMCIGQQTVALIANSNATSFVWSPAIGLSATTGNSVTANPTIVGPNVYTVVGTAAGNCTVSTTATVTVYALPVPTASTNIPCETENPLNLTCTVAPAGTYTYNWSGPNTFTSNIQNPSITTNSVTQVVAGTYTVLVTDVNSCYNSTTVTVVVNNQPTITATGATVCVGQTINLTSTGAGATGNYSWNGQGGVYTSGQQNPSIINAVTGMTSIYNVVGTDANGCYSGTAVQVQVNPLPIITVTSGTICLGQETATLTASSSNAGTTYSWAPPTGLSTTTGSMVVSNPSPAGTYTYLVTGTDANTCVGTFSTSVLVNSIPTITANSSTICVGQQTATLTAASTNPGTTYNWAPATGLSSTTTTVVTGTPTVTTNYVITGTDGNGCINTGNASILVNILPTITATSGTICTGQTITLTASGGLTYTWTPATGLSSTTGVTVVANPTVTTTSQNYSYIITGTDANSCVSTGSSLVIVYPLPVVTVTSGTICMGQQTTTLTANGASTYTWTPSNTLSNSTGTSVFGFPANIGENDYTVTATDVHTCINTATTSIWVNSLPTVTIHTITPECVPFCATLTATPTPAVGTYAYSWSLGNGQTSLSANPTPCYSVAGVFAANLLITDANGCTTTASTPVNALSVPIADFDYGQQPVSILAPEVQFTNQSTYGLPIHNWNFGDIYNSSSSDTSSVNNPSHTYIEVGTYNVTLIVSTLNGCSATVVKPVIINEDYALYVPNAFSPNSDGKNEIFKAVGEGIKDYKLYVFDRWGLLIFYSDDIDKGWDGRYQGSSNMVQEDVYVWKIQATDFTNRAKNLHGTVTLLK